MAETGCLKDGNFQNLEAQQIMLGTASLVAPLETTGKNAFDTITTGTGDGVTVTLGEEHLNSIYYINPVGGRKSANQFIKLPILDDCSAGDKIIFYLAVVTAESYELDIMQGQTADRIYGAVPVYTACGNTAIAGDTVTMAIWGGNGATGQLDGGIRYVAGATGAGIGTTITFTCIGGTTTYETAATTPSSLPDATPTVKAASTKNWHISGFIVGNLTGMTGEEIVRASA
jgi:hypothetical protein